MDRKWLGAVFFEMVAMVTSPQLLDVVWCSAVVVVVVKVVMQCNYCSVVAVVVVVWCN